MKSLDRKELNDATVVAYALMRALFDEVDEAVKERVIRKALAYMPPAPNRQDTPTAECQMWDDVQAALKKLAGL